MNFVKLSIIIPVYNDYKLLKKCLQSISQQSFKDFEVIVVDDGSKAENYIETQNGLDKELIGKIEFFQTEHGGAPQARNFGFRQSIGEYLFFCDADVIFLKPNALQKMVEVLDKNPNKTFCYSAFKYGWKKFHCGPFDVKKLKQNNYISGNSMIRRDILEKISINGPWDENLKKFQDWDLWLTIIEHGGEGIFIPRVLWQSKPGGTMSKWLPGVKFNFYKVFKNNKKVKEFEKAKEIVKKKHGLNV